MKGAKYNPPKLHLFILKEQKAIQEITARNALMLDQFLFFAYKSAKVVQNVTLSSGNFGRDFLFEFFMEIKTCLAKKSTWWFLSFERRQLLSGLP